MAHGVVAVLSEWTWFVLTGHIPVSQWGILHYSFSNVLTVIDMTVFMVLSSWRVRYKSSPSSSDECRTEPGSRDLWTKLLAGAAGPPIGSCSVYVHPPHLITTRQKADTRFTVSRRVEGWVDLGGWLHTKMVWFTCPSSNWAWHKAISLIKTTRGVQLAKNDFGSVFGSILQKLQFSVRFRFL